MCYCIYLFIYLFCYEQNDDNKLVAVSKFSLPTYLPPLTTYFISFCAYSTVRARENLKREGRRGKA